MPLIGALKKIFSKRNQFDSPRKYILNSQERDSVLLFCTILIMAVVATTIFLIINQ